VPGNPISERPASALSENDQDMITEAAHRAWLNQSAEDVLDPETPVIDAHHHLWHGYGKPVPWQPDYWQKEQAADLSSGHNIVATVFMECGYRYDDGVANALRPIGETRAINGYADSFQDVTGLSCKAAAGIVGFADLTLGTQVQATLEGHLATAPDRFRGIRQITPWDPSPEVRYPGFNIDEGLMLSPKFGEGFGQLHKFGLSFDAWVFHPQIPEVAELATRFPETTIILDHFGGPLGVGPYRGKQKEIFAQWKRDISLVAQCPNVFAKLGGLAMEHAGFHWHERPRPPTSDELVEACGDYYLQTIDLFGPERCMFEANFPVDKISCSYRTLWNAHKKIARRFGVAEQQAMFFGTAKKVYRLDI